MNKLAILIMGIIFLVFGVIGLIAAYAVRPPSDVGEALMMIGQNRMGYLKAPYYHIGFGMSLFTSLLGIILTFKGLSRGKCL